MRRETTTFENDDAQRDPSKSFDSWIGAYTGRYSTRVYNQQSTTNNRQHQHVVHVQDQRVGGVGSGCHLKVVGHPTLQVKVGRFPAVHVVRVLGRGLVMVGVVGVVGGFQTDGDQHDNRLPNDGPWRVGTCERKQKSVVGWLCEVERIVSAAIIPHQKNTTAAASLAVSSQYHHWQHQCGSISVAVGGYISPSREPSVFVAGTTTSSIDLFAIVHIGRREWSRAVLVVASRSLAMAAAANNVLWSVIVIDCIDRY